MVRLVLALFIALARLNFGSELAAEAGKDVKDEHMESGTGHEAGKEMKDEKMNGGNGKEAGKEMKDEKMNKGKVSCSQNEKWSYSKPECWKSIETCDGKMQSPVDIVPTSVANLSEKPGVFMKVARYHPVGGLQVTHDGTKLKVTNDNFGYVTINQYHYFVRSIEVRFPSEHTINGKSFYAEVQIRHQRMHTSADTNDDLLMVSVLFNRGPESTFLNQLLGSASEDKKKPMKVGESRKIKYPVDLLRAFGPSFEKGFFRYDGSLTTPPCSEGVKWLVFETPMTLSEKQWEQAKTHFKATGNNRPTQALMERNLTYNSLQAYGEAALWGEGEYEFILHPGYGRNRTPPEGNLLWMYVAGVVITMILIWFATFISEDRRKQKHAAGGLVEVTPTANYGKANS